MEDEDVLERILDGADDPTDLPLALLQKITANFSSDRKIGQGGFGEVYKGVLGQKIVAVKRICINESTVDDRLFRREFASLWNTNHRNVVRFLCFCSNTYQKTIQDAGSGEPILVNVLERLLCFEYISNGSLDKHITDELRGLEWKTRYEIIIGICKGLRYLHEEKGIIHMDLKPANILLHNQDGKYMIPKITDFGLSRPNENSHTVGKSYGTRGYWAPEYRDHNKTSPACDIYSLGAIIIELVTGCMDVPNNHNVLRRWRHRWNRPPTQLQYQQVTRCIDIAGRCREQKPEDRPSISNIIRFLSESESTRGQISPHFDEDDMLGIKPLQLLLPSELRNETSRSVELTNGTRNCIAFYIQLPSLKYIAQPEKGIVPPESKRNVKIMVRPRDSDDADKFIVKSMKVSHVLIDVDITERRFEEAGEVVDEVNLVVVYEPMKPLKSSREDINMPAEEVPEAKKRKIVESACGKGKNKLGSSEKEEAASMKDISSSALGQCTEQRKQCKFYPPQSFSRHYPTNLKYLGRESDRVVDVARGAMGSLLDKLGKLVTEDYSLDTSIKSDIESFSEDLRKIHLDLPQLEKEFRFKFFVDEVRELSYNIENMIDSFLVHVEPDSSRSGFREIMHESVKLLENSMTSHHQIGDVIRDIKDKVQAVADRQKKYNFDVRNVVANATIKATTDFRVSAVYEHKEQLVGIKEPRDDLIRLLEDDGDASKQKLKIISIVGMGGLGKTTLAKAVYDKMKAYRPKAFVSVGQNPDVETVLKKILAKIEKGFNPENLDMGELIGKLKKILKDKRYFIVIDDIWESTTWRSINYVFPRNKHGSRVITTTRNHDVALACCSNASKYVYWIKPLSDEESRRLFTRRAFGPEILFPDTIRKEEISKYILKRCGGMPLAINTIAGLLAGKEDTTWEYVWKSFDALTEGITALENMKKILDLSYIHLPDDLKTCLVYVCMHPEDWEIDKKDLLRQWEAEGFVNRKGRLDAEDVAENNFKMLIDMCLIEPGKIDRCNNEVLSCRVHDIILELVRSKSSEVNFTHVIDGLKDVSGQIRRVSVQDNDKEDVRVLETIKGSLSHVRSVFLYRGSLLSDFLKYTYVRVLHLEHLAHLKCLDLSGISRLFLLRYLKISCFMSSDLKLPDQIGELQQLETIDLVGGELTNYPPDIVSLPWLSHLRFGGIGIPLPDGINRLNSLRTLEGVCVHRSSVDNIKGLGELTNLRKLGLVCFNHGQSKEATSMRTVALHSSICKLSASLRILTIGPIWGVKLDVWDWSSSMFPQVSIIRELDLRCCVFQRCPGWISQLCNLYKFTIEVKEVADGFSIVAGLPSLAYYSVSTGPGRKEESVVIPGCSGAFQALKHLDIFCPKASLTFEAGARPKLEMLEIAFRFHMARRFLPVGIGLLQTDTLKEIRLSMLHYDRNLKGSKYFTSDEYNGKHRRRFGAMLKRAFKPHYPDADITIQLDDFTIYDNNEDYEIVDDEEDCCNEDDDKAVNDEEANEGGSPLVNGSQTSAQVQANKRHLVQLMEEQEDSGWMSIETDAPRMVDTSLHLAVGSEGQQSELSKDLSVPESLRLPSTYLLGPSPSFLHLTLAPCSLPDRADPVADFPVDINNDLSVQLGNNGMLVNAVGQYVDLNQAPPAGLVDLNQAPPAGLLDLNQDPPDEATNINSSS